jgi:hypothetical protein
MKDFKALEALAKAIGDDNKQFTLDQMAKYRSAGDGMAPVIVAEAQLQSSIVTLTGILKSRGLPDVLIVEEVTSMAMSTTTKKLEAMLGVKIESHALALPRSAVSDELLAKLTGKQPKPAEPSEHNASVAAEILAEDKAAH